MSDVVTLRIGGKRNLQKPGPWWIGFYVIILNSKIFGDNAPAERSSRAIFLPLSL